MARAAVLGRDALEVALEAPHAGFDRALVPLDRLGGRAVAREQATGVEDTLGAGPGLGLHLRDVEVGQWGNRMERRRCAPAQGEVHTIDCEREEMWVALERRSELLHAELLERLDGARVREGLRSEAVPRGSGLAYTASEDRAQERARDGAPEVRVREQLLQGTGRSGHPPETVREARARGRATQLALDVGRQGPTSVCVDEAREEGLEVLAEHTLYDTERRIAPHELTVCP